MLLGVAASLLVPILPSVAQAPPAPAARFIVVLDAAHGGGDSGGRLASGQMEKAATLALSVRLRSQLTARGIAVLTTRESDVTLDSDGRAAIANHAHADACLSLHATESGSGLHLFTSSLAPTRPDTPTRLGAPALPGGPAPRFPAWKTAQSAYVARSIALAGALNAALRQASFNVTLSRTALTAVDSMTCPALAVELAPERGPDGAVTAEPDNPDYQARVAAALASAILAWRADPENLNPPAAEGSQP
ncbi:MAG TPA: N-acetylmuramoyl-L-alanine amidase [Terracidiphilus sp.]|jgi:N-acetylmuramoyl-L-alanine amidase|nr:N-acetylmuramoyl-L-alanine amidase [Terracidiphilus sp.]